MTPDEYEKQGLMPPAKVYRQGKYYAPPTLGGGWELDKLKIHDTLRRKKHKPRQALTGPRRNGNDKQS